MCSDRHRRPKGLRHVLSVSRDSVQSFIDFRQRGMGTAGGDLGPLVGVRFDC